MNATMDRRVDCPVERDAGVSIRPSWRSSSTPYPQFFTHRRLLSYDYFLASALLVGALFQIGALWTARRGRYPRTDTFGGTLVGPILMLLAGVLLFTRLLAIANAA